MGAQGADSSIDIVNNHLFNELQTRANQMMIKACINPCFYDQGEVNKVYSQYTSKSRSQKKPIRLKTLSEESGTIIAIYKSGPEEIETLDIILIAQQDIESMMFESLKALVWYKWFFPLEKELLKQLSCITDEEVIGNFFFSHVGDVVDNSIEEISVYITGMIQAIETGNIETLEIDNPEGTLITEEGDKDG